MKKENVWKVVLLIAAVVVVIAVFVFGPQTGGPVDEGPQVVTPSMGNLPGDGQLSIETQSKEDFEKSTLPVRAEKEQGSVPDGTGADERAAPNPAQRAGEGEPLGAGGAQGAE